MDSYDDELHEAFSRGEFLGEWETSDLEGLI